MANITKGKTFISGETVEPADLHQLVDQATIAFVAADDTDNSTLEASGGKLRVKDAGVNAAKLATGAVTGAAGGGKLAANAITGQTQKTSIADADELLVHSDSDSALRRVAWSVMQPNGTVLQTIQAINTSLQNCSTSIFDDNSIPQNTEGDEILSATITPASASSKILIQVVACGVKSDSSADGATVALFKDAAVDAIAVGPLVPYFYSGGSVFSFLDTAGTTSAITYKVRAGAPTGSFYLNGNYLGSARFGGKQTSSITLQEIKA